MKTLKQYLKDKHLTHHKAAEQLKCSRVYLTSLVNGAAGGKAIAEKIEEWSGGEVSKIVILYPTFYNGVSKKSKKMDLV